MTDPTQKQERQREVVDQSDDVRDPADDSGEADDPAAVVETYPQAFDDRIDEAAAAIHNHDAADDRRHGGGN